MLAAPWSADRQIGAATAADILAAESIFRIAVAANLLAAACYLVMATFLYELFRSVDRTMARLAVLFLLVSCVIGALDSLFQYAALDTLQGRYLGVMSLPERQAIALLLLSQHVRALDMGVVFFGFFWLTVGTSVCAGLSCRELSAQSRFSPGFGTSPICTARSRSSYYPI